MSAADGFLQSWQFTVTTVAAAVTPYVAWRYRQRRLSAPKTPQDALYSYYDKYIDRLEAQLIKKDELITALEKQNREQRDTYEKIIQELEEKLHIQHEQLNQNDEQIKKLKHDIEQLQNRSTAVHRHIEKLKHDTTNSYDKIK